MKIVVKGMEVAIEYDEGKGEKRMIGDLTFRDKDIYFALEKTGQEKFFHVDYENIPFQTLEIIPIYTEGKRKGADFDFEYYTNETRWTKTPHDVMAQIGVSELYAIEMRYMFGENEKIVSIYQDRENLEALKMVLENKADFMGKAEKKFK